MSIKEKTLDQIEAKIENIEEFISENGVGSKYLSKAERVQRDVNLGLAVAGFVGLAGLSAWAILRSSD
ncbi:MAG: hypothetical protein JJ971_04835 [Balneolaceae bacterium]|nr:hypothetical protein [Balneolaceae bacterium]MBO6545702.1 hypothetical protein [Balneolaceae bacterium]MBO6647098.1 hypothetical protein [Balneolaceae bacterium]